MKWYKINIHLLEEHRRFIDLYWSFHHVLILTSLNNKHRVFLIKVFILL